MAEQDRKKKFREVQERLAALSRKPEAFNQSVMAERAELASRLCNDAYDLYDRKPGREAEMAVWEQAASLFHQSIREAFPDGFWESLEALSKEDISGLETAIKFLEDDPYFFRSGYIKADILKYVRRVRLSASDAKRLRRVVIAAIKVGDRREFRWYCKLARRVESPAFRNDIEQLLHHDDEGVRRRARWVLAAMDA
ncbi:MAG: hypothetical protein KC777_25205 [Cyanobacteria bacterium HKST-UBA02]|nr:hypothetical protein [Cyanobacteria bacterium HKST-UBA02]